MTRLGASSAPELLDQIERVLGRATHKGGEGYPPYNIERLHPAGGREVLRLVIAVAGFAPEQLDVTTANGQLVIRGRQGEDERRVYLHQGIAARRFQRTFLLADGVEVGKAELKDGLLSIDLQRPEARPSVQRVAINGQESPRSSVPGGA